MRGEAIRVPVICWFATGAAPAIEMIRALAPARARKPGNDILFAM
jgi:hypothetical protein